MNFCPFLYINSLFWNEQDFWDAQYERNADIGSAYVLDPRGKKLNEEQKKDPDLQKKCLIEAGSLRFIQNAIMIIFSQPLTLHKNIYMQINPGAP